MGRILKIREKDKDKKNEKHHANFQRKSLILLSEFLEVEKFKIPM